MLGVLSSDELYSNQYVFLKDTDIFIVNKQLPFICQLLLFTIKDLLPFPQCLFLFIIYNL